jgi:transcriptional regulator with XRE-family HTH domain
MDAKLSTIGGRIAWARARLGMTQQALADAVNVRVTSVSRWENDKHGIDADVLPALADALQISIDWLLRGQGWELAHADGDAPHYASLDAFRASAAWQGAEPWQRTQLERFVAAHKGEPGPRFWRLFLLSLQEGFPATQNGAPDQPHKAGAA